MNDFDGDKAQLLEDLARSRAELAAVVEQLQPGDFQKARRGSWTVARVLGHVLHSEGLYTQLTSVFSGKATAVPHAGEVTSAAQAAAALDSSREAFLDALGAVGEEDFYRLATVGHEEYSVLSILENNAMHDREHAEQIRRTIGS